MSVRTRWCRLSLCLLAVFVVAGCQDGAVAPEDDETTATWETIATQILEPNCAQACHVAGAAFAQQSGLVLTADVAYDELVGVAPANEAALADGLVRVSAEGPAGLDKSYLWEKVNVPNEDHFMTDHPEYGALMPLGGEPLTYGELAFLRQWILAGAPEDGVVADPALLDDTERYTRGAFTPLAPPARGIQLRVGPFEVAPQFERELFYYEPFTHADDLLIERIEVAMRPGSHHFLLYTFPPEMPPSVLPAPRTIRDLREPNGQVNQQHFQPMLYHVYFAGTQWPRMDYRFPEGIALRLPAGTGLDLNAHYANRRDVPVTGEVHVNLHVADPAAVERVADVLFVNNTDITLPPGRTTTLEHIFRTDERIHIFQLFSHAHEHMDTFEVEIVGGSRAGEQVYWTNDWAHPPILELDPPLTLEAGQGLRLRATYTNDTDQTLRFGLLSEEEMMILFGYYYRD